MANRRSGVPQRNIQLHALWRDAVLATHAHACICCGETEETTVVQAHHVVEYSKCPALGYDVRNGVILCCRCHAHLHSGRPELSSVVEHAIEDGVPGTVAYVKAHMSDLCPDYGDAAVRAVIRAELRSHIPADYITYHKLYDMQRRAAHSASMKEWYAKNKSASADKTRRWYLAHKDRAKELSHAWYEAHKADVLARTKAYAAARKEKYREYQRAYRERNRARILEQHRASRARIKARQQAEASGGQHVGSDRQ